ncbi:hypothetical protein J6590_046341, partial [Homalodisca vitripennis]
MNIEAEDVEGREGWPGIINLSIAFAADIRRPQLSCEAGLERGKTTRWRDGPHVTTRDRTVNPSPQPPAVTLTKAEEQRCSQLIPNVKYFIVISRFIVL